MNRAGLTWRRGRTCVAACALAMLAVHVPAAAAVSLDRPEDPVIITGAAVPALQGKVPGSIVAFRYSGGWQQVPVQVDERAAVDLAKPYNGSPTGHTFLAYADAGTYTGADPDTGVDANDEIALMAKDAGDKAPSLAEPAGVISGTGQELRVTDPLGPGEGYVYVYESGGSLDPSAGAQYVNYQFNLLAGSYPAAYNTANGPNPENTTVTTPFYSHHFSDRWIDDQLRVTAPGASGADILDRHKFMFAPGDCLRSEDSFSNGEGAFVVNKNGPVRAIRSYMGANSGPYTERSHIFYQRRQDIVTDLRVHPIAGGLDLFDYSPAASGMTYRNDFAPAGVTVDGNPESPAAGPITWETVDGSQGGLSMSYGFTTDIPGFSYTSYYLDDSTPGGGAQKQCTGDAFAYGTSGPWLNSGFPNTDPNNPGTANNFQTARFIYYESPGQANGTARKAEALNSLQVSVSSVVAGYPRPKGATPLSASLVAAFAPCTAANRANAPPLSVGSCSPATPQSSRLTIGTPDANGATANSTATVTARVTGGDPATPADEADVTLGVNVTDVRRTAGLSDYTGELQARLPLRAIDRTNTGPGGGNVPGTTVDFTLAYTVPCAPTVSTSIGGTCAVATTADALAPGTVLESRRTIWELGQVGVNDGGADDTAATEPNTAFLRQGVFTP